ncbi:unnamed protein product [Polarella glacialis]|uniref:Uncharacterized protein n=1 Tax=Polarella glacialis TaxID=89957 RepID=A0A813LHH1_POLGL|nr:unnamed protein product [Polarella glacialis]
MAAQVARTTRSCILQRVTPPWLCVLSFGSDRKSGNLGLPKALPGFFRPGLRVPTNRGLSTAAVEKQTFASTVSSLTSLARLDLADDELESLLAHGRRQGPQAAHAQLVSSGQLENDAAQSLCAEILQTLWTVQQQQQQCRQRGTAEPPLLGCYLWGQVGGGKSLLLDIFAGCFLLGFRRVHFHEFMEGVHQRIHELQRSGAADCTTHAVAKQLAAEGIKVLVFDEFQITNISDALIIETLLSSFFAHGMVVLMSANRPPEDLYKNGMNRHSAIPKLLLLFERWGIRIHRLAAAKDFRADLSTGSSSLSSRPWRDVFIKSDPADSADDKRSGSIPPSGLCRGWWDLAEIVQKTMLCATGLGPLNGRLRAERGSWPVHVPRALRRAACTLC